eukprot:TRINITY_DN9405_c0_g1_i1.p1 TRINITY_DN9405_c0_g1~~TRINITY_DN9405_c0_g1_i1.p1  ORF type:complete len:52 (+),score=9.45 TRINITY_DN9405_c0_g1_i1:94-249(+)
MKGRRIFSENLQKIFKLYLMFLGGATSLHKNLVQFQSLLVENDFLNEKHAF